MTSSTRITRQLMLDAVYLAAEELKENRFALIDRAGLWRLFFDREAPYSGPPVVYLEGLAENARKLVQRKLIELLAQQQKHQATTLTYLNLRPGPGTHFGVLSTLPPQTEVQVLAEVGDWLEVKVDGQQGFVHRDYVKLPNQAVKGELLARQADLLDVPMAPPPQEQIDLARLVAGTLEYAIAQFWNRYGQLLAVLANELRLDPGAAVAVFLTESGGQAFAPGPDGRPRMVIRFENHIFFDRWGRAHPDVFNAHFAFDPSRPWTNHRWRAGPAQPWQSFHGNQTDEWQVYTWAAGFDITAARESISMGLPQIMGFNYVSVGYATVHAMFEAFESSVARQIFGFFDFVRSKSGIAPLRQGNYHAFAEIYNGPGQAAQYAFLIQQRLEAFRGLRRREAPAPPRSIVPTPDLRPRETPALPMVGTSPARRAVSHATLSNLFLAILVCAVAAGLIGLLTQRPGVALALGVVVIVAVALYGIRLLWNEGPSNRQND